MGKKPTIDGHLRLDEQRHQARRRLIISGLTALVMMASGVALVAGLKPAEQAEVAAPDESQAPDLAPDQAPAEVADAKPDEDEAAPTAPAADVEETPPQAIADPAVAAESGDAAKGDEPDAAPAFDDGPSDDGAAAAQGAEGQWWLGIHGKRCKLELGEHKRLIMREGRLNKDESTTYGPFANGPVAARVQEDLNPEVTVHHIGLHPRNQRPSLAYVTLHQQGKDTLGILPLQISGDQLTLTPVAVKAPRR